MSEIDAAHDAAKIEDWLIYLDWLRRESPPVEYEIDEAHEDAQQVEWIIGAKRAWDEARAWTLRKIDAAHEDAMLEYWRRLEPENTGEHFAEACRYCERPITLVVASGTRLGVCYRCRDMEGE